MISQQKKQILATSTSITSPEVFEATLVQEVQPFSLSLLGCNFSWKHFNSISVASIRTLVGRGQEVMWHAGFEDPMVIYPRGKVNIWILINSPKKKKKKTSEKVHVNLYNISLLYTWICIDLNDAKITGRADLTIPACPRSQKSLWPTVIIHPVARPKSPKIRIKNQQQTFEKPLNEHNAHIIHLLKKMAASVCPNFDVRFFPPNQFSNSWHHKTHLGIFLMGFFSDKNSPSDLIPPATDSFTNFVGGIGTREFLTFSSMAGPNSPPRCCRSAWLANFEKCWW